MEKIWLNQYPQSVPAEINPDIHTSIIDMFDETVKMHGDRPSFYLLGKTITFLELDEISRTLSAFFQHIFKLQKGDHLAIMLPNVLQYPITMLAALRAGLVVVNVNPLYTASELSFQLNDAKVKAIVILKQVAHTLENALQDLTIKPCILITDIFDLHPMIKQWAMKIAMKFLNPAKAYQLPGAMLFKHALKEGKKLTLQPVSVAREDVAFLQYTGGTTGISKGAILTHRNMLANLEQVTAWFNHTLKRGREIIITALPLYHIFSLLGNCLFFIRHGSLNVLIVNPKNIASMIKEMKKFKFTAMTGVNTLFAALLKNKNFRKLDFSHLNFVFGGGMAVKQSTADEWQTVTRLPLLEGYGLTEASPVVSVNPCNLKRFNGSIGLPLPSTDVAFLDNEGKRVPFGEIGELAVKGPQVMQGYFQNPEETKKVFTEEGWLLTGDMASMDHEGYIRIVARKKDMILVSGFNVYPSEIENVLMMLNGIQECAVIGVSDIHTGEAVKAFIVRNDPFLSKDTIHKHCKTYLTSYKLPKIIEFIDELPKSHVGKVLRRKLCK